MVEFDEVSSVVPKQGFKVPDTRDTSNVVNEKTINFVESRSQVKDFVEENSMKDTRTSLACINEENFILEEFAIQRVALVPHHRIEGAIVISMTITVAPKNEDSQEREFRPTLPVLSLEQRCGMMVRDMYLTLEAFGAQLDLKVRSCSKSCPPISKDSPNRMSAQTVRVCAYHLWTTYLMSYLNTNKAN